MSAILKSRAKPLMSSSGLLKRHEVYFHLDNSDPTSSQQTMKHQSTPTDGTQLLYPWSTVYTFSRADLYPFVMFKKLPGSNSSVTCINDELVQSKRNQSAKWSILLLPTCPKYVSSRDTPFYILELSKQPLPWSNGHLDRPW